MGAGTYVANLIYATTRKTTQLRCCQLNRSLAAIGAIMQKKISGIPRSQFLEVDFPCRKAFEQNQSDFKPTGYAAITLLRNRGDSFENLGNHSLFVFTTRHNSDGILLRASVPSAKRSLS
jgi:hypothetical protein